LEQLCIPVVSGKVRRALRAAGRVAAAISCRALASAGIASTVMWTAGCYAYFPKTPAEVTPNTIVAANISDVGRVAIGERVGTEVSAIEGLVVARSDTALSLMVSEVRFLNGLSNHWQGQEVSLRPIDVKSLSQRTFSRSRTVIMLGGVTASVLAAVLGLNFLGVLSGDSPPDKGGGSPPPES
jgi:hypothetical protein